MSVLSTAAQKQVEDNLVAAGAITKEEFRQRFIPDNGNAVTVTLPWPPSANRYWRNVDGIMRVSEQARKYKQEVRNILNTERIEEDRTSALAVTIHMYRPTKTGDVDNYAKVALDSMQGQLYKNDSQIIELHVYRHDDKLNPRLEITVARKE